METAPRKRDRDVTVGLKSKYGCVCGGDELRAASSFRGKRPRFHDETWMRSAREMKRTIWMRDGERAPALTSGFSDPHSNLLTYLCVTDESCGSLFGCVCAYCRDKLSQPFVEGRNVPCSRTEFQDAANDSALDATHERVSSDSMNDWALL